MKHPNRDEWMSYLYDESSETERTRMAAHLLECAECRTQVEEWTVVRQQLDSWRIDARKIRGAGRDRVMPRVRVWKWAAAAVLMLGLGFTLGRMVSTAADTEKVRQQLMPELRQWVRDELGKSAAATLAAARKDTQTVLADYTDALETALGEDDDAIYAALNRIQSRHEADYVALKRDLDTVAVLTDANFRRAQQQINQVASDTHPAATPESPQK
jgi:hypothetical protein